MRGHTLISDEPVEFGGKDKGPTSTELVLSGLASCTASTLRMYVDKKGWDVERIDLELSIHIDKTSTGQTTYIVSAIAITGNITEEQKQRMLEIARKCPVHRLLTNSIAIDVKLNPSLSTY